jgi:short-subunit dehydrogenase
MGRRKINGARTVLTGASSGIGRAIAVEMARRGARLVVTARRQDRLDELKEEVEQQGGEIHLVVGDVTDPDLRTQLLEAAQSNLGGLDILINNAGVTAIGEFRDSKPEYLERIMAVNFFAPVELIRKSLPMLDSGNRPIIVNMSSVLGHRAVPKKTEYCTSKFALHGFSDALRAELSPQGIDVLLISPTTTKSEIFDVAMGDLDKSDLGWLKLGAYKASTVARITARAIRRGRHEVIISPGGKALVWADCLCPSFMNRMIAKFA